VKVCSTNRIINDDVKTELRNFSLNQREREREREREGNVRSTFKECMEPKLLHMMPYKVYSRRDVESYRTDVINEVEIG
jgi:hypothetical protein